MTLRPRHLAVLVAAAVLLACRPTAVTRAPIRPIAVKATPAAVAAAVASPPATFPRATPATFSTAAPPIGLQPTMRASKAIAVGSAPDGMAAIGNYVYCANTGDGTLSVIEVSTDAVVKTIPVEGGKPGGLLPFRDKYVLALETGRGQLLVFDTSQDHKLVQTVDLGPTPDEVRPNGDDGVVVSLTGEGQSLVRLIIGSDVTRPPLRASMPVGTNPGVHRSLDVEAGWVLAPNGGDNSVSLTRLRDGSTKALTDGDAPGPVAIGASAAEVAVAAIVGNTTSNTVTLFDIPDGAKTTLSDVGRSPAGMVVHPKLGRAFVTMADSHDVAIVDYIGKKLVSRVEVGARPMHAYISPRLGRNASAYGYGLAHTEAGLSNEVWVGNDDGGSVTLIEAESGQAKATIATGKGHHKMAFAGDKLYVSNGQDGTVSVIDRASVVR